MTIVEFLLRLLAVGFIGYLLGSIPSGVIIGRKMAKVDVTQYGSGKMGTTNVLRVAGKKAAILVALLDILKGAVAVFLAGPILGPHVLVVGDFGFGLMTGQAFAGLAAMAGHNWSVFLRFKGGRGVATFFGGLVALSPVVALFGGEIIFLGAGLTRFVSVGSIAGAVGAYAILVPLTIVNGFPVEYLIYAMVGAVAIIITHRDNIARLVKGRERRLGDKAEKTASTPSK